MREINSINIPLLIGKTSDKSIINPEDWLKYLSEVYGPPPKLPKYCILSFKYTDAAKLLVNNYEVETLEFASFSGDNSIHIFKYNGMPVCFTYLGIGSSNAGMLLEELMALGVEYAIFFGGVGALKPELHRWKIILPTKAIRDEGTSYHYQFPSIFSYPSSPLLKLLEDVLEKNEEDYVKGVVWTTDSPYRETIEKRRCFLKLGAICVDMEASALFSIAKFRGKHVSAIFYAGDLVVEDGWDVRRGERYDERKRGTVMKLLSHSLKALYLHYKLSTCIS